MGTHAVRSFKQCCDPDRSFHFDSDPDPTFQFDANPANGKSADPPRLHFEPPGLHCEPPGLHCERLRPFMGLYFEPVDANPDPDLDFQNDANPDPQHLH